MKSRPIATGQSILATQNNDRRDDARGGSFLFPHQQLGSLALGTNPTNGQTVTFDVNGTNVVATFVTVIGSTANNILIGGTAAASVQNLLNWLRRPDLTNANQVAASGASQTLLSYVGWAWPGSGTSIVPFSLNKNVNGIVGTLTSFNITTTVTSGTWTAQTMQLCVQDGTYYINGARYLFTGGSTPTITAPVSHPRIDVLTIDTSGTLAWTTGTENVSPVAPTYPANKFPICELYNVVSETALYDNENQQAGQGYIYNDVRSSMAYGPIFSAIAEDLIPDAADTRSLGSASFEWNAVYAKTVFVAGIGVAAQKFGGTGADGALSITSGTTTINLANAAVVIKNYSSISITGTGQLAFSNPNVNGTIVILKSQGNVTITSSASPAIDLRNLGATGGAGVSTASGNPGKIFGFWNGMLQTVSATSTAAGGGAGAGGGGGGSSTTTAGSAGSSGSTAGGAGGGSPAIQTLNAYYMKALVLPGGGGASASTGNNNSSNTSATGGTGGGALYLECGGALNITGTINASGSVGGNANSGNKGGGGGGGGGGSIVILYATLTANSGTYTVSGGAGGSGDSTGGTGGTGANGFSLVAQNTEFA
jgi:hypothetical protein